MNPSIAPSSAQVTEHLVHDPGSARGGFTGAETHAIAV